MHQHLLKTIFAGVFAVVLMAGPIPAFAKGGADNPTAVIGTVSVKNGTEGPLEVDGNVGVTGTVSVDDDGNSLTVDTDAGSLGVDIMSQPALTHMGQFPVEHVTLKGSITGAPCSGSFRTTARLLPNGLFESSPFVVPDGKVFVITDIFATILESVAWDSGDVALLGLQAFHPTNGTRSFFTRAVEISVAALNSGVVAIHAQSISGVLLGESQTPCVGTGVITGISSSIGANLANVDLQGYLIDE